MNKIIISIFLIATIWACAGKEKPASGAGGDASLVDGAQIFKRYCIVCHGVDGKLGVNGAKDLTVCAKTLDERIVQVTKGKNVMTPFEGILTPDQIKAVASYTLTLK